MISIVETKLYKNPDKRQVIAQMLDYGAALWKSYGDGDAFLSEIDDLLAESTAGGMNQALRALYGLTDDEIKGIREAIRQNLADGNLKFVVLMDRLHERLRDLILFINSKSQFDVYAIEMEFYEHEGMEIVIPKLFGAEVKKEVSSGGSARDRFESDAEFLDAVESEADRDVFRRLLKFADELGAEQYFGTSAISTKLPDPAGSKQWVTLYVMNTDGEIYIGWSIQQLERLELPTTLGVEYAKSVAALVPGVRPHPKNPDLLSRHLTAEEIGGVFDKFTATVERFAEQVKQASVE